MNQRSRIELAVFAGLLVLGVGTRVLLADLPNFAPVAAMALFAGYFFRSRSLALAVPLVVMLASDMFIGFYDTWMMLVVYGSLATPVLLSGLLRRRLSFESRPAVATAGLVGASLGASLFFFTVTNFASWLFFGTYSHDVAGLTQCYVQAIPFFRYTLAGDLLFAFVLFGGYSLVLHATRSTSAVVASATK